MDWDVGYEVGLTHAVVGDYAYFTGTGWALAAKLTVDVAVENLSYNKQVGIRYSVDGWATSHDVAGTFNYSVNTGGGSRIEYWSAAAYGLPPGGEIEYAIYYRNVDWGTEYWDNNFGQNYAHVLTTGTEIR